MTNSIWHKASEKPELNKYVVVRKHGFAQWKVFKFDNKTTFYEPFTDDLWAYVADIILQADKVEWLQIKVSLLEHNNNGWAKLCEQKQEQIQRLQKAVDYALQVLENVSEIGGIDLEMIKIEQMIKD